jgi:hypothetical protein
MALSLLGGSILWLVHILVAIYRSRDADITKEQQNPIMRDTTYPGSNCRPPERRVGGYCVTRVRGSKVETSKSTRAWNMQSSGIGSFTRRRECLLLERRNRGWELRVLGGSCDVSDQLEACWDSCFAERHSGRLVS